MKEPSVFDYVVSLFDPKKSIRVREYLTDDRVAIPEHSRETDQDKKITHAPSTNWKIILGTGLALFGQIMLEPSFLHLDVALMIYTMSFIILWLGFKPQNESFHSQEINIRIWEPINIKVHFLLLALACLAISFLLFSSNSFNLINLLFWLSGIVFMGFSFWMPIKNRLKEKHNSEIIFVAVVCIVSSIILFFRLYLLKDIPGNMFSDHAEKLLDVMDVLNGKYPLFFERNTGREPIQFYFTALIIKLFSTGINFISLKIGTVIFGIFTLPFIYLIAKELSNKWGGIFAAFFAGIGYWPNVISRIGLRYALYPLFAAPVIYFLLKAFKCKNSNYFILSGIFLGFGLNGYSSFRIVPLLVVVIIILFDIYNKKEEDRAGSITGLSVIALTSLSIFLPLFRYWVDHPESFSYRAISRVTQIEHVFDNPAFLIFINNFFKSILMPFYNNGHIWVHSIPNSPALDFISAAFFFVGIIYMVRQIRFKRDFRFAVLLISIPVLMLPSILSLAYPGENPSLNRSAGAYVPIFVITGIGVIVFLRSIAGTLPKKYSKSIIFIIAILIAAVSMLNNYKLVFDTYKQQYDRNAWNTSEIGAVIRRFVQEGNSPESAFVIPYPHWVDTRLVGINAGYSGKDYALARTAISTTIPQTGKKIYIYKPEDIDTKAELDRWLPDGEGSIFYSEVLGKEFIIYTVKEK